MAEDEPKIPTSEDMAAGGDVVQAGADAAAAEPDPKKRRAAASRAIKKEAESKGWELSEDQANMLAGMTADMVVDKIQERGGFEHLPEPLTPPPAPTGAGTLPAQPPPAVAGPDTAPGEGRRKGAGGFAGWFRSS